MPATAEMSLVQVVRQFPGFAHILGIEVAGEHLEFGRQALHQQGAQNSMGEGLDRIIGNQSAGKADLGAVGGNQFGDRLTQACIPGGVQHGLGVGSRVAASPGWCLCRPPSVTLDQFPAAQQFKGETAGGADAARIRVCHQVGRGEVDGCLGGRNRGQVMRVGRPGDSLFNGSESGRGHRASGFGRNAVPRYPPRPSENKGSQRDQYSCYFCSREGPPATHWTPHSAPQTLGGSNLESPMPVGPSRRWKCGLVSCFCPPKYCRCHSRARSIASR